jgi:monoamine oxidase
MISEADIIVVGAGASGLLAARELTKTGMKVKVLEGRDRLGGRIHTINNHSAVLELGAEFVHGNLPLTLSLLEEANIAYIPAVGKTLQVENGQLIEQDEFDKDWNLLGQRFFELKEDMTLKEFLEKYFNDSLYADLRESVIRFASGYDTADIARASSFALRDEWFCGKEMFRDYLVKGGYRLLIDFLATHVVQSGNEIHLSAIVKEINWEKGKVRVITNDGKSYTAGKVLITVPLGVLKEEEVNPASIRFSPPVPEKIEAAKHLGFGAAIKILLEFKTAFWAGKYPEMEFLLSNARIPTWWTRFPEKHATLAGWLGGPQAELFESAAPGEILDEALTSLEEIFEINRDILKKNLLYWKVKNWATDPFTRGSYSYATVDTLKGREVLNTPVADTLFFAGEALYDGPEMGTVEAAFASAMQIVKKIING